MLATQKNDGTSRRGPRAIPVQLSSSISITVYSGARVEKAFQDFTQDLTVYQAGRFLQVAEAIYEQGRKDGRGEVFDQVERQVEGLRKDPELKHAKPGRPKKAVKKAATKKAASKRTTKPTRATKKSVGKRAAARKTSAK